MSYRNTRLISWIGSAMLRSVARCSLAPGRHSRGLFLSSRGLTLPSQYAMLSTPRGNEQGAGVRRISSSTPPPAGGVFFWLPALLAVILAIVVMGLLGVSYPLAAQTCPWTSTVRQEACPGGGAACVTKGSTLTYTELDKDLLNIVGLCSGPGLYTWPSPSTGLLRSDGSGTITLVTDDDIPDGDGEVPDALTISGGTIGSSTLTGNTMTGTHTITGTLNLDSGTEGTLRLPSSTTTPGTCTIGDTYFDTDADVDGSLFVCRATNTWKEIDDDGGAGGGAPTSATYLTLGTDATLTNERVFTAGTGINAADNGAGGTYVLSLWSGDTLAGNPTYSTEDVVFTKDGTGGGLLFEGVTADTIEGIVTWNPTTSDKTITLPDVSGTVITTGDTGTVTGGMITNDSVVLITDTVGNFAAGDSEAGNATGLVCTTCVGDTDIASDAITEPKLKAVNSPTDEFCLTYEVTTGDFEWQTCGGGGGGNSFTTIDTTNGTDPVADSTTDTLILADGDGITITGNSTTDAVTIGIRDPLTFMDITEEFCGRNTTAGVYGASNFSSYGSNSLGEIIPETNHPCIASLGTSTSSGDIQSIGMGKFSSADQFKVADHLDRALFVLKVETTVTTMEVRVGFMDDTQTTTGGDGFFIEYDSSVSANWRCITRQGGTTTATVSAVAVAANTWYQLEIERTSGGNYQCYVNSTTPFATHTTNIPTGALQLGMAVQTNVAAGRAIYIDLLRFRSKTLGQRY